MDNPDEQKQLNSTTDVDKSDELIYEDDYDDSGENSPEKEEILKSMARTLLKTRRRI